MGEFLLLLLITGLIYLTSIWVEASVAYLLLYVFRNRNLAIRIYTILFLPGTLIHEMAHIVVANLLGLKTFEINLMPRIEEDRVVAGEAYIQVSDPIRQSLVGMAPFVVGQILLVILSSFVTTNELTIWQIVVVLYLVFQITNTQFSSKKDLEGVGILFAVVTGVMFTLQIGNIDIWSGIVRYVEANNSWWEELSRLFMIPLGINILVVVFGKLFRKLT